MANGATPLRMQSLRDPSLKGPSLLHSRGWHVHRRGVAPSAKKEVVRGRRRSADRGSIAAIVVSVLVVVAAVYIMVRGFGLNPDLDFGAGAYYYADIPDYQKTLNWDVYAAQLPFWVYLLLFLAWGWLMWRLWKRIEK